MWYYVVMYVVDTTPRGGTEELRIASRARHEDLEVILGYYR